MFDQSPRAVVALFIVFVLSSTLTGLAAATEQFPAGWQPLLLAGGILGQSLSGALAFFLPQLRPRPSGAGRLVALLLAGSLVAGQAACSKTSLARLQNVSRVAALAFDAAPSLVADLAARGLVTAEEAERVSRSLAGLADKFDLFDSLFRQLTDLRAADSRERLASRLADFTDELGRLNAEKLLFVKNEAARARLGAILRQAGNLARLVSEMLRGAGADRVAEAESGARALYLLSSSPLSPRELRAAAALAE